MAAVSIVCYYHATNSVTNGVITINQHHYQHMTTVCITLQSTIIATTTATITSYTSLLLLLPGMDWIQRSTNMWAHDINQYHYQRLTLLFLGCSVLLRVTVAFMTPYVLCIGSLLTRTEPEKVPVVRTLM